ncbi:MAG: sigma-70 family RNA polymerase sigma factor [Fimbriimonadaceae bacterium]
MTKPTIPESRPMARFEGVSRGADDFERMKRDTEKRAFNMAMRLTRNPTEAEDLVQETYVKAWRGFEGYMPDRPFLNWLLRIMQRAHLDAVRRRNPVRDATTIHAMVSARDGSIQDIEVADEAADAEEELLHEEFVLELKAAMAEIPSMYREAIRLCDIEGMSYEEIADEQGTTVGTVRSRIHRGRKLLRTLAMQRGIRPVSR